MAIEKRYYKNSNTGDLVVEIFSSTVKGITARGFRCFVRNNKETFDDDFNLTGFVPIKEAKYRRYLKLQLKSINKAA